MASKTEASAAQVTGHVPPKERLEFRKLLASNPNYFGNLANSPFQPVKKIVGNPTYEQVTCVGFNPALNLLEATVQIKLPGGYNGTLCTPGSTEYVRFFIDYGAGWVDAGLASFNAHDIPNTKDCEKKNDKPLSYVVTLPLDPQQNICRKPVLPKVRAILSWQLVPTAGDPNWPPVWGNVLDEDIQIKPRLLHFVDVVNVVSKEALKDLPEFIAQAPPIPIPLPDPAPLSLQQLAEVYQAKAAKSKDAAVEPHRFGYAHLQTAIALGNQDTLAAASAEWKAAKLDLAGAIAALDKTKADVSYEEVECLGLEYNLDRLVATFEIKRPTGYNGTLCFPGSQEYVAFWADWDDTCEWTYLDTVSVNVHDFTNLPGDGLSYSAILPVDLSHVRRPCGGKGGGPKIARIRAVLSWATPPSTTDPDKLNHWGNRIDAHVQIRPGTPVGDQDPEISIIGGIGKFDINVFGNGLTKPAATFAFGGGAADAHGRECPFGRLIIVQGPPVGTLSGDRYRIWARKFNDVATEHVVKDTFHVVDHNGNPSDITPNPVTGFSNYLPLLSNINMVLAHWNPTGDDLWQIRLELATAADVVIATTAWHNVQLDNTAPRPKPPLPPFEPPPVMCEIHIDSGGDYKDFSVGTLIQGHFTAQDAYFGNFSLTTLPASMGPNTPTTPTPFTSQTASFAAGGDEWQLVTTGMTPCGYVVLLQISDRSILYSIPGHHNYSSYDLGFCLRK
jgi:hypothetical protein